MPFDSALSAKYVIDDPGKKQAIGLPGLKAEVVGLARAFPTDGKYSHIGIPVHYMNARHVIEIFMPFDSGETLYGCTLVVPPGNDRRVDSKPALG